MDYKIVVTADAEEDLDYNIIHMMIVLVIGKAHEKQCMIRQSRWQSDF